MESEKKLLMNFCKLLEEASKDRSDIIISDVRLFEFNLTSNMRGQFNKRLQYEVTVYHREDGVKEEDEDIYFLLYWVDYDFHDEIIRQITLRQKNCIRCMIDKDWVKAIKKTFPPYYCDCGKRLPPPSGHVLRMRFEGDLVIESICEECKEKKGMETKWEKYIDNCPENAKSLWQTIIEKVPNAEIPIAIPLYTKEKVFHFSWSSKTFYVEVDIRKENQFDWFWRDRVNEDYGGNEDKPLEELPPKFFEILKENFGEKDWR